MTVNTGYQPCENVSTTHTDTCLELSSPISVELQMVDNSTCSVLVLAIVMNNI